MYSDKMINQIYYEKLNSLNARYRIQRDLKYATAQSNFHHQKLFEDTSSSSLLRSSYNQRQEQRYLLQSQLEQELLQNQIHQRYLEHRYSVPQTQHRNEHDKLPPNTTLLAKSQQKYSQYNPYYHTLDNRVLPAQQQSSSATTVHTDLNNTSDRFTKQINFNLNNVNHYYNSTKHCTETDRDGVAVAAAAAATNVHLSSKSIGYNTCNNSTIARTKPYQNNICSGKKYDINNRNNNHDTYIEYLQKPIKMQSAEIVIEHTQLVLNVNSNGNDNTNPTNPTHRPNHYTQILAALAVSLGPLAAGLGKGYSSPAIASLQELQIRTRGNYTSFTITDQEASWVASLSLLGALFGGVVGGFFLQFGRRRLLTFMSLPFSLSWILTVFATSVVPILVTAFVGGFCCAIVSMVTQVYISEIASPDIRGFLSAIQKIAGHVGILISFSLGAYLDWRQLAMLVSIAPMLLFFTVIYIPETPSFLVLNGRDDEAYRSLQWLHGPNKNIELELETIRSNIRAAKPRQNPFPTLPVGKILSKSSMQTIYTNIKSVLKNVRIIKPIGITCGLMVFQRFTGANSFGFYAVKIFRQTFAGMNPHGGAIAVSFVQLLAAMLSGLLIDTVGRIPLLIISSVFMSLALASFGSYVYYEQSNKLIASTNFDMEAVNTDWIPLLCVLVFTIAFSLGISPISSLLVGELFPLEYRGIGSSIATSFSYFCAFISVKTFIDFQELFGLHGAFWLYAGISCCGLFFVVMCVPETKGRDLDEMDPKYERTMTINR
ncbi:facilitated trehalose transporter Tret1-like [Contarinia nasturtii]|uniref:facilitated trehalose transporter Tret1-like n=1 Tax=Contarinia nasturtii TaxID=265458 RepID=UPI0012D3AAE8|nr:facilitated trehalose transporter Tret1-like [Contarinia nasturtii]